MVGSKSSIWCKMSDHHLAIQISARSPAMGFTQQRSLAGSRHSSVGAEGASDVNYTSVTSTYGKELERGNRRRKGKMVWFNVILLHPVLQVTHSAVQLHWTPLVSASDTPLLYRTLILPPHYPFAYSPLLTSTSRTSVGLRHLRSSAPLPHDV